MADKVAIQARYGASELGNFYAINTIEVPHPYVIGAKHVNHAADRFGGMLGEAAVRSAEMAGIHCQMPKCKLSFDQHEQAVLIACKIEANKDGQACPELHAYLLKVKPLCEEDHYAGFAFMRDK
jgi:hypothetical protein